MNSEKAAIEIWCEIYEIDFLKKINQSELGDLLNRFEFISVIKGPYSNYYSINKILFIIEAIQYLKFDIKELSNLIDFSGFESLIEDILIKNDYATVKNYRFSDKSYFRKKTNQTKYEVDVIGLKRNFLLFIDAKQWRKRDLYGSVNKAANLQLRRAKALQKNPEIISGLIQLLTNQNRISTIKLPLIIIPIIVTFEENHIKLNESSIPLVSIYRFNSFLQELKINLSFFSKIEINKLSIQKKII